MKSITFKIWRTTLDELRQVKKYTGEEMTAILGKLVAKELKRVKKLDNGGK